MQSSLNENQIENLYNKSKGKYIKTTFDNFKSLFNRNQLSQSFEKVEWILLTNRNKPHKTAFREFLTILFDKAPNQKMIDAFFTDGKGKQIKLAKYKKDGNTGYWACLFEAMIS